MKHSKRFWSDLFYVPKYEKVSDKAFLRIMLSSIFGILICGICLAGLTWAWFTSSITSTANTITAADFSVGVEFKQNESVIEPVIENESYKLNSGTYTVTVTASGSATTGYCKVELKLSDNNIKTYRTIQLYPAGGQGKPQSVDFTVNAQQGLKLTIIPQWGTFGTTTGESLIGNGLSGIPATETNTKPQATVSAVSPEAGQEATGTNNTYALTDTEQSYTVQQGDTLSEIANRYGTTAEVLSAYNNIENAAEIKAGDTLKIPPANVAEETTASQTQNLQDDDTSKATTDEP